MFQVNSSYSCNKAFMLNTLRKKCIPLNIENKQFIACMPNATEYMHDACIYTCIVAIISKLNCNTIGFN
jgi:hypothetical protein